MADFFQPVLSFPPAFVTQVKKMKEAGYVLGNLDCTIIAQKPKLSPHKVR